LSNKIKLYIEDNPLFVSKLRHCLELVEENKSIAFVYTHSAEADIKITTGTDGNYPLAIQFYKRLAAGIYDHSSHMPSEPFIKTKSGVVDPLASIFYLVNCIQEFGFATDQLDHYDRFPYEQSLQYKYGIIERNLVQEIIDEWFDSTEVLQKLNCPAKKSSVFLCHDIDFVYEPIWSEIKWSIKHAKLRLIPSNIRNLLDKKSIHLDTEFIQNLHDQYGYRSHYFWITNNKQNDPKIKNGDYKFKEDFIQKQMSHLKNKSNIGLHKSTNETSLDEESVRFDQAITLNRYHYLKYQLPQAWQALESSQIKVDCSLAFGSIMGFRNSYGRPFTPYNLMENKAHNFKVIPFQIMDSSWMYYSDKTPAQAEEKILQFISSHQKNCVISSVWHNTSFTQQRFSPYLKMYQNILKHITKLALKDHEI